MREAGNRVEKRDLDVHGHARRHALHVNFSGVQPLRLQKELVALLIGKAQDLRLDGRAVARPNALDNAVRHGGAVEIVAQDSMRFLVRVGEKAIDLRERGRIVVGHEGKVRGGVVSPLEDTLGKIDGARVHARRRPRLKAHEADSRPKERVRQLHRGALAIGAAVVDGLPDDDPAPQIRSRR